MTNKFMNFENKTIGVIGYGNFGKVVCNNLFPENNIILFSKTADQKDLNKRITLADTLEELVTQSDIIIPCVPIRNFKEVIKDLAVFITPGQIVMDICSVKEYPAKTMQEYLPHYVEVIASHPMFGPNSIKIKKGNLKDMNMVLYNISANETNYNLIKQYLSKLKLKIIEISPEEHDQQSAQSQFFSMIIGQLVLQLKLNPTPIDTPGAHALFEAMRYTGKDITIIEDMIKYNRYCKPLLHDIQNELAKLS
jgi:prephenate dehydrogenase